MKFIPGLLMSLALTASATAATTLTPVAAPIPQQHRQIMPRIGQLPIMPMSLEQLAHQRLAGPAARTPHPVMPASLTAKAPRRAKTEDQAVEIILEKYSYNWYYYEYSQEWYCSIIATLDNGDEYDFNLDFYSEELYGEYTTADIEPYYTYGRKNNVEFSVTECSFTVSPSEAPDFAKLDGTFVTTLGETLHIVVAPKAHEHQDITVEGKQLYSLAYYDWSGDWNLSFQDWDNYRISLDFINPVDINLFAGEYTLENCWDTYCYLYDMTTGLQNYFTELQFTATGDDPYEAFEITGSGVLDNGDNLTFHFLKSLPIDPIQTIQVDANLDSFLFADPAASHNASFVATSVDQKLQFHVAYKGATGSFTSFDMMHTYMINLENNEVVEFDNGLLDVTASADNVLTLSASLIFKDSICYELFLQKELEVVGQKTVEAHNLEQTDLFGLIYYLMGSNDEYDRIQASIMAPPFAGDWTEQMVFVLNTKTSEVSSRIVKSAIITEDDRGNFVLDALFLGDDFVDYTLHMDLFVPDVTSEATFVSHNAELQDLTQDYGAFQIYAMSDDGNDYFSIVLDAWYVHSGNYDALSSANKSYCQVVLNLGTENQETLTMYNCNVDFTLNDEDFTLTGICQAGSTNYTIDLSGQLKKEEPQGDMYDDPDNDIEVEFSLDEIVSFEYQEAYGYHRLQAQSTFGEVFYTLIYSNSAQLEEGVYPISKDYTPGTVQAGSVSGTSAYPTFYAQLNEEGLASLPLWLCVEGTVTVSYVDGEISMVVDAANTWGRTAHIVINDAATGIYEVANEPKTNGKSYENQQFVISSNGQTYNAFGQKCQR